MALSEKIKKQIERVKNNWLEYHPIEVSQQLEMVEWNRNLYTECS